MGPQWVKAFSKLLVSSTRKYKIVSDLTTEVPLAQTFSIDST